VIFSKKKSYNKQPLKLIQIEKKKQFLWFKSKTELIENRCGLIQFLVSVFKN
jgi:hypothetical protein